jgi:hypothetical protein
MARYPASITVGRSARRPTTNDNDKSSLWATRRTKINGFDPALLTVSTAYATPPFLPFFHPPIKLATRRPRRRLDLDRWTTTRRSAPLYWLGSSSIHIIRTWVLFIWNIATRELRWMRLWRSPCSIRWATEEEPLKTKDHGHVFHDVPVIPFQKRRSPGSRGRRR